MKNLFRGTMGRIRDIKIHKSGDLYYFLIKVNFGECINEKYLFSLATLGISWHQKLLELKKLIQLNI